MHGKIILGIRNNYVKNHQSSILAKVEDAFSLVLSNMFNNCIAGGVCVCVCVCVCTEEY